MKKRIVEKYYIEFSNIEIDMSIKTRISKKVYDANMTFLHNQTLLDEDADGYKVNLLVSKSIDKETYTLDYTCFNCGCADTRLYRYIAKDGYTFNSND